MIAIFMKIMKQTFSTQVINRVWKTQWKTELFIKLYMEKRGKNTKKVEFTSKTVDKPVETVDNFMQKSACGKLLFCKNRVEK